MRFPSASSQYPLLNITINKLMYSDEIDSVEELEEESTWESLVDEEDDSSEDSFRECLVNDITDKVKLGLGLNKVNTIIPPQTDIQTGGVSGPKVPIISEESIRRLQAMEDWYNGPMDEATIARRYKDWLYLQTRALEMAESTVGNSINPQNPNHA